MHGADPLPHLNSTSASRRQFLRFGWYGFSGLAMSQLMRLRAQAATAPAQRTAIILVWLRGGMSQLDTFDMKPQAPSDYRGPYQPIRSNVPGIDVSELLPRMSQIADRYTLLRSVAHTGGGHPAGSLQILSGDPDAADKIHPKYPDWMSVAHKLRNDRPTALPNYITVNPVDTYDSFTIAGPTYLGPAHEPFRILGDPSHPKFEIPNIGLKDASQAGRLQERVDVRVALDRLRRSVDQSGVMDAVDQYEQQALSLLMSPTAREAFDLSREDDAVRDRYGRNQWGQQCLMARRLVEAGVEIITTEFDGPLCGRVQNWDDHSVNQHIFDAYNFRMPTFDQAVSALIEDVYSRGLDKRVMVVVTGEFGRTPRISHVASSGGGVASGEAGTVQPGRDHWPQANTMIFAGGGIRTGQVIGATNARAEEPVDRRVGPEDFLATIYQHLGFDAQAIMFPDFAGRPTPILNYGHAIPELMAVG